MPFANDFYIKRNLIEALKIRAAPSISSWLSSPEVLDTADEIIDQQEHGGHIQVKGYQDDIRTHVEDA